MLLPISQVLLSQYFHLLKIARYLNFLSARSFSPIIPQFSKAACHTMNILTRNGKLSFEIIDFTCVKECNLRLNLKIETPAFFRTFGTLSLNLIFKLKRVAAILPGNNPIYDQFSSKIGSLTLKFCFYWFRILFMW